MAVGSSAANAHQNQRGEKDGKWRPRSRRLPVTMVVAMAFVLVLVLWVLDYEGGFLRELRSTVAQVVVFPEEAASSSALKDHALPPPDLPHCLAKTQHLLYRKASLRFPTPARIQDLFTRYEEMHRRCTVGKDWDKELAVWNRPPRSRRRLLDDDAHLADGSCQYLFLQVDPGSGLGNRLLGIVSGFLYALVTNRAIVTDPKEDIWHLFCEPFQGSSWFLPQSFPVETMTTNRSIELKDAPTQDFPTDAVVTVRLKQDLEPSVKRFWCAHTQEELKKVKWILWRSNQHLIPRFFSTPYFWPQLRATFSDDVDPSRIFLHLSRYLVNPHNFLWDRILRIFWSEMVDAKKRVGVQIRRHGSPKKLFSKEVHERMMQCMIEEKLLPNTTSFSTEDPGAHKLINVTHNIQLLSDRLRALSATRRRPENLGDLWELVHPTLTLSNGLFSRRKYGFSPSSSAQDMDIVMDFGRPITVLIASLRPDYWEEMKAQYTNYPTQDGSLVRVLQVTHDTNQRQSFSQMGDALVEMWLLSLSDVLVISSWSTFGYVPIGLSGISDAYIMNVRGEKLKPEIPCLRWQTSDPCNHFPFLDKVACTDVMSQEQEAWVREHVRQCETRTGIQLLP